MHISGRLPADVVEAGLEPSLRRLTPEVPQLKKEIPVGIALAGMAEPREIWFVNASRRRKRTSSAGLRNWAPAKSNTFR